MALLKLLRRLRRRSERKWLACMVAGFQQMGVFQGVVADGTNGVFVITVIRGVRRTRAGF